MESITRKTMLYKSNVEFEDYSMNYVLGCSHGCNYPCYARLVKKVNSQDWIKPKIVSNTLELLDKEIPRLKEKIKQVHLCFSTDPFMYKQSGVVDLSLKVIEKLISNDINIKVLSKGLLPSELIDIEKRYNKEPKTPNQYGISLVSVNESFRGEFEPYSAPYTDRIESLRRLSESDIYTYIYMEPFYPDLMILAYTEVRDPSFWWTSLGCVVLAFCLVMVINIVVIFIMKRLGVKY